MSEDDFFHSALKEHVLSVCGIVSICIGDCRGISIKIFERDKNYLSETTIICFFGLKENHKMTSPFVLDSLSRFTGHTSWEDFKNAVAKKNTQNGPMKPDVSKKGSPPPAYLFHHHKSL